MTRPAPLPPPRNFLPQAARPNLFIEIPARKEGLPAIEEVVFAGVPVNVTLLFSREQYLVPPRRICGASNGASPPGFFPGRFRGLDVHGPVGRGRGGQSSGDIGKPARHRDGRSHLSGLSRTINQPTLAARIRWRGPATTLTVGEHQRRTKASDILYVKALAAPLTVNTMPEATLKALADYDEIGPVMARTAAIAKKSWPSSRRPHQCGQPGGATAGRGHQIVCEIVERFASGDCVQEQCAQDKYSGITPVNQKCEGRQR